MGKFLCVLHVGDGMNHAHFLQNCIIGSVVVECCAALACMVSLHAYYMVSIVIGHDCTL